MLYFAANLLLLKSNNRLNNENHQGSQILYFGNDCDNLGITYDEI
jgi:hypothetical protein